MSSLASLAIFIALEVAALLLLSNNNQLQRMWFMRISYGMSAKAWGVSQTVNDYLSLRKQNDELALLNTKLIAEVNNLQKVLETTDSSFLTETRGDGFTYIPATIVKANNKSQHNYLIIDKGSADGVSLNSGVVTPYGVIGIVDGVSKHYSYVISFQNVEFNISARIGEGTVGPLSWDGIRSNGAILREIPLQCKFNPGDTIYTSGYSSIFPPDIPLGTTGDSKIINGATNEIKITLFQDHGALKHVIVTNNTNLDEIDAVEKEGNDKQRREKR